jgi:gluconate kinase
MTGKYVVVSGLPASGKTTLARQLAYELRLPLIDKDDILETLFESLGVGDAEWRSRLSRASDAVMVALAKRAPAAILVSFWRHGTAGQILAGLNGDVLEVHCRCDPEVAFARFVGRQRHPGHLDGDGAQGTVANFAAYPGPLRLGGPVITIDTDGPVDVAQAVRAIRAALRVLRPGSASAKAVNLVAGGPGRDVTAERPPFRG